MPDYNGVTLILSIAGLGSLLNFFLGRYLRIKFVELRAAFVWAVLVEIALSVFILLTCDPDYEFLARYAVLSLIASFALGFATSWLRVRKGGKISKLSETLFRLAVAYAESERKESENQSPVDGKKSSERD